MATSIHLQTQNGLFVSLGTIETPMHVLGFNVPFAHPTISATEVLPQDDAIFILIDPDHSNPTSDSIVGLQCFTNSLFLGAVNGGGGNIYVDAVYPQENQGFQIIPVGVPSGALVDGQKVAIRTWDKQHYFSALNGGNSYINAGATAIGSWETFTLKILGPGPILGHTYTDNIDNDSDQKMDTTVNFSSSGVFTTQTHIWTEKGTGGFHGSVIAFPVDKAGNTLANTPLYTYGVDGTLIPGLPSSRTLIETANFAPSVYNQTNSIRIIHLHNPTSQLMHDIDVGAYIAKDIGAVYSAFQSGASSASAAGSGGNGSATGASSV